jgi:inorganic triphosphatase YgiF
METHIENELKFTAARSDIEEIREELIRSLKDCSLKVGTDRISQYTDRFYDDRADSITSAGCFVRLRSYSDGRKLMTIKRPVAVSDGSFSREEIEEAPSTDDAAKELQAFCAKIFPKKKLVKDPVLEMTTEREKFALSVEPPVKVCLDRCFYTSSGHVSDTFTEIEIEAIDSDASSNQNVSELAARIGHMGFSPSKDSKYARGLKWSEGFKG